MIKKIIVRNCPIYIGTEIKVTSNFLDIRKSSNSSRGRGYVADICPICKKDIEKNDDIFIVANNYKLFSNTLIHKNCIENKTESELVNIMENLTEEYSKFKELMRIWI